MTVFQHILAFAIQLYRWTLSPLKNLLFGPAAKCRFQPSCSEYALEAVKTHGTLHGSWLGLRRLCRCHPWGSFGYDPVPGAKKPLNMEIRNTVDVALGETIALKSDRALGPNNLDNHAGRPRPAWLSR